MITIQDVMTADAFEKSVVIAGRNGITREVSSITVAEVPDSASWLHGGELVCTTAFFISSTVLHQKEWLESIIRKGASALAIKTSRFLGTLPASFLEVADRHHFPIIELPHEITWPIVIESFMDFFTNERIKIMQHIESVQSELINFVLENQSIQVFVDKISHLVGNPIILEDARLNVIAIGKGEGDCDDEDERIIAQRLHHSFRDQVLTSEFYKGVQRGWKKGEQEEETFLETEEKISNTILPIFSNKSIYGFLSVLQCKRPCSKTDLLVLRNSVTPLALQMTKQILNQQTFRKKTLTLIDDLIQGRVQSQIMFDYDFYNINWSHPMICILIEFTEPYLENEHFWGQSEELISSILRKQLRQKFEQVIIGSNGALFTVLAAYAPAQSDIATQWLRLQMQQALSELDENLGKDKFLCGIGGAYKDLKLVGKSFKEANQALSIAKTANKGKVVFFEDIGIHRIFSMISNTEDVKEFCDDFLSDLKRVDQPENTLLNTLHTYLLCDSSVKETASKMYLHPNTISHRIKKIKEIIKYDLDSAEFKAVYLFALECCKILQE